MSNKLIWGIISVFIFISIVGIIIAFYSSYIGYYGYDKDKRRRFSKSLEESKKRNVFIKELDYSIIPDSFMIDNVFIEEAYRWGSSSKKTRPLSNKDTIEGCLVDYPYQVVVAYSKKQYKGDVSIGSKFQQLHSRAYYPIRIVEFNDTINFHLVYSKGLEIGFSGKVKVWNK